MIASKFPKPLTSGKRWISFIAFLFISPGIWGQTQTFTVSGTFTVPLGVTSINVECWGAGGAGGGSNANNNGGSGGGGGGFSSGSLTVTPNQSIPFTVGVGGTGVVGGKGNDGTSTSFLTLTSNGGTGGAANTGAAGTGGTASGGTINTTGIDGNVGTTSGGNGGAGANGGTGGTGSTNGTGGDGAGPGGGGGGGERGGGNNYAGGNGGTGQIVISWTPPVYYSYQTGSWNTPGTWTLDPSGTTQVGNSVPGNNDFVIILTGRTVTLPSNIATTGLDITIEEGGFLDLSTWQFTAGLLKLSGQGTLAISSGVFPTPVTTNTFVNAGGGTTEYRTAINLPSQATYNNLTINAVGLTVTQTIDLTLNGNLHVKSGTFRINDNTSRRLKLTVNGDVTVDAGAQLTVGTGVTNSTTNPLGITGGTAPFINYYDLQSHRIVINGNFTNNGTVRFTNLTYPVFNAFPPATLGATSGFATVYFQGASNNTIFCAGPTDFYNLVLDKGTDQTFKLTIYTSGSSYANFRLFGANIAGGDGGGINPNLKKALWIRTGTLVLEGLTIIPSLSEGTGVAETPAANPNSDFYVPSNGALVLNGTDVVVLSTADDYREVNLAYNTTGPSNASMGIAPGGTGCALSLYGKLQINNGYLSTRESGGIITSSVSPGQFVLNNGTVDAKQFLGSTGSASYEQNGGLFILRGRFQRTPTSYNSVANLVDVSVATLNNIRSAGGISGTFGTFNLNNASNVLAMTGGTIRIYDVCGDGSVAAQQKAFDVLSSTSNINVTGGTLEMTPVTGSVSASDSPVLLITSNAILNNLIINRVSSTSIIQLNTYTLRLLNNLTLTTGVLNANNLDVTVGGNITIENGTTYTTGTNTTILNGLTAQTFTVNLGAALSLNRLTIDKAAGSIVNFAGNQTVINVNDNFRLALGTLNDNGNTINVYRNVFNSGLHTGTGKIAFIGTTAQTIDGNGIFNNVELNNNTAVSAPVALAANMTINGGLTFSRDKLFNIGIYNLKLNSSASILNGGALRYVQTSGNSGDGGLTKVYSATTAFLFPVGAPTITPVRAVKYTPASIGFNSAPATYGSITVIPVGYEHPATTVNGQSLTYFWSIKSSGFSGIPANSVTHAFVYDQTDVVGTETNYSPTVYNRIAYTWNNGLPANINTGTNTISDWSSPTNSTNFLDGDYSAGDASFGGTTRFYSIATGNWRANTTWSNTSGGPALPAGSVAGVNYPGPNSIVVIENNNTVSFGTPANYLTAPNTEINNCASLQIAAGSVLDIRYNPGSNFGMVLSLPGGNGNFRLTTAQASGSTFTFPLGDFSEYNINLGTTELYSTEPGSGTTYWLPNGTTSYGNLIISPLGGSNIIFPNNDLTIYGNLITRGQNADSWFCPTWSGNYPNPPTARVPKTITVNGNLDIQGGSLIWYGNGAITQNFVVNGNVIVAPNSSIDVYSGATSQNLSIGGSLINNTVGGVATGTTTTRQCDFTLLPVTFFGNNSASISNTLNNPPTIFETLIVNKGTSPATTLTCDIGGTLTTPVNNWLTILNGTFRYMRTNPSSDFTISTTAPFTIPSTAGLYIDYSNTGNRNILIANDNTVNTNDVFLNGKLTLIRGNVYIGQIAAPAFNNDIEYSGGGASEIDIRGGILIVNGQIRQTVSSTSGILKYKQSGGAVTINGNSANITNAKLEVLNSGEFTMSAGTITLLRGGGGSTYGDLYLRPATGSVTGGDIIFLNNLNGSNQQYLLDATLPLNNLTITGRTAATAATATVKLLVNPLVLNGNLTLTNVRSILDVNSVYNLPITIKGDFTNNGTYNNYNNLTTFDGGTQSLLGTSSTSFYDLNVSPVTRLTLSRDITVFHDLLLGNGTLECLTYLVNLKGNIVNNATFTNTNSTSGIILNGTSLQRLSGTGTFGQLELNNTAGGIIDNSITLTKDLVLTTGIFDITEFLLTLGQNSSIVPKGTAFSASKMITSDGVWSNVGILKVFGTPLSTTFTYPLGTPGKYTPAVLTVTANGSVGSIRINNINSRHPAVLDPANVLKYYWEVESTGITGLTGNLLFSYKATDVEGGPESSYVAAQLLTPGTNWSKASPGPGTDNVNETNHTIAFNFNNSSNLTGQYTAGNDAAIPGIVPQYTSNRDGDWTDNTIWTPSGGSTYPCPVGGPNGFIVTIDHVVTANANYCFTYKTTINNKLRAIVPYYGHNFGSVYGNGTLYIEGEVFPAGRFGTFLDCSGNSTLEYGGTGAYNINATLFSSIPRLYISGTGNRILPDKDLTICKQLLIDDGGAGSLTLDNSIYKRRLVINGTFERYNNGAFRSGTGASAIVEFAGSSIQTIGGLIGDFTGTNAFNNLEINNNSGLVINNNGSVEINGDLLLTNGLITTTSTNKLTINNFSVSCVYPDGGSATSYIDGPLIKKLNQGDPIFKFPVGKKTIGLGNNLSLRATQTGTLFWVVEYVSPNTLTTVAAPLTAINDKEYWNVSGIPATSQAFIDLSWNSSSSLTPLMTENGLSDMRVAENNGTDWIEIPSAAVAGSDNFNGSVETSNRALIVSGSRNFTLACVNTPKPRIRMSPAGPICGASGIPVTLTTTLAIVAPFTVNYTENGVPKSISPASFPATIPTLAAGGIYILTGFTYNYPAGTTQNGVFDNTSVTTYAVPTTSAAGTDQSLCGATSATLAANAPLTGTGLWSIISGAGGTIVSPTVRNSVFNGTNGSTYVLRWTISNGTCISSDDVTISFPLLAAQPAGFSSSTTVVCQGNSGVVYTVPNDPSVTYNWSYSGTGATINGSTNSVTLDFNTTATSGTLSVTATNSCNTSAPQNLAITVNQLPTVNVGVAMAAICQGGTTGALGGSFGGGATSAVWSDGGAGGTFTNNTGSTPGTATYTASAALVSPVTLTLTTSGGSCGTTFGNKLLTVTGTNTVTRTSAAATTNQTVCINTAITPITYSTTGATGATVTNLPTGVTGSWAANVVTISGTPTVAGAALTYTVTLTGGCGTITTTGTIAVTANNTVTRTSAAGTDAQTVCINTPITPIAYSTTGATGATVTNLPTGVTGSWAANVVTISGTPTLAGAALTYTVTLTGGCGTVTTTGSIAVTANNTVTRTSAVGTDAQTVCINTPITPITYSTTGATGATVTNLPTGVTGSWAANVVTISGTPTVAGAALTYTVTLTGGCGTVTTTGSIAVTANNTVTRTSAVGTDAQTVCINTPITPITYSTTGATGATVTNLPTGVTGSWAANVVTISGTPTVAGAALTYTVTLTGGCGTITTTGTIAVTANNTVTRTSAAGTDAQTVCINTPITPITYSTTGATGATVTNLPTGVTGSWAANVVTISGTPTVAGAALTYTVTLTGGCGTITTTGTIAVTANNTVTRTSAAGTDAQTVCINTPLTPITYSTTGATGATVTNLPTGVTGSWAANVVTISGTPTVAGAALTYTVTLTGGCGTVTTTGTIAVNPSVSTPIFTLGATSTRCRGAGSVTYTVTATNATGITYSLDAASITGGNSIEAATGTVTYVSGWSGISIITASAAGCNGPAAAIHTVTVIGSLVWTGTAGTDWNDTGNWSCGFIPDQTTSVQIPDVANKPVLSTGAVGAALNILIDNSSSLILSGNTLQISGTITNNGTFDATDGTIEMTGSLAQNIGGGVFASNTIKNLIIDNPAGVTLLGPLNISGILTARNGDLTSGGNLTLLSTVSQTALIDGTGNGDITGNISMQRYLSSGLGYKYFSSPFQAATVGEFGDDMDLTALFSTFYRFDENRNISGVPASGWVNYNLAANLLNPMSGYAVNFGPDANAKTVDVTGIVNNGPLSIPLYNHDQIYTTGFNLVGNPYPSPIDWDLVSPNNVNIDKAIYFFNATDEYSGTYTSYVEGVSSNTATNIIPSMQGFFVHVTPSFPVEGTLVMDNSVRITDLTSPFAKSAIKGSIPLLRLTASFSDDTSSYDPVVLYFNEKASANFDTQLDALKLFNTAAEIPNLFSVSTDEYNLSINALPFTSEKSLTIPIGLSTYKDGNIIFKVKNFSLDFTEARVYFSDLVSGTEIDLSEGKEYRVSLPAADYKNRFFINFSNINTNTDQINTENLDPFLIYCSNGILKAEINDLYGNEGLLFITNILGQTVFTKDIYEKGHHEFTTSLKDGIYIASYMTGKMKISKKILYLNR